MSWDGSVVCTNISFAIHRGKILCLVGKSGSGKTTIFHALAGLTRPDKGSVWLDGRDITAVPGNVSYMLQKDLLLDERTIIDNVSMPLRISGLRKKDARKKAQPHFAEFGLEGTEKLYPSQLSGGMRQRAALLRTYLMDDEVVLMDEPFSALDSMTRTDMQQWLLGMVSKLHLSVMLITHDIDEAIFLADEVLVLASIDGAGSPSTIVGTFQIECPRSDRADFMLTPEALELKRAILSLLN